MMIIVRGYLEQHQCDREKETTLVTFPDEKHDEEIGCIGSMCHQVKQNHFKLHFMRILSANWFNLPVLHLMPT